MASTDLRGSSRTPGDAGLGRLLRVLAVVGIAFVAVLAVAPLRPYFAEWRRVQQQYNARAAARYAAPIPIALRQVWQPDLGIADRCVSCHLGMSDVAPLPEDPLFVPHPRMHHAANGFGCTPCHGGQGRATTKDAAHGRVSYWDEQLLPAPHVEAGCSTCHDPSPSPRVQEAEALAQRKGCLGCHRAGGRGGDDGPALDAVGLKPVGDLIFDRVSGERTLANYMRQHVVDPGGVVPGSLMVPQPLGDAEADLLTTWILSLRRRTLPVQFLPRDRLRRTLLDEPRPLMTGEAAFAAYCSACHGARGEGYNYGGQPTRFPAIGSPDFLDIASDDFLSGTITLGRPGRRMPPLAGANGSLRPDELTALVAHLRSLGPAAPSRAAVEAARPDPVRGADLYRGDCAVCHGPSGEGTVLGPPLATSDAPARARDRTYDALARGVDATAMPAYRIYDAASMRAVIDLVTTLARVPGSRVVWRPAQGSPERGLNVYVRHCAGCHGDRREGKVGPSLANTGFLKVASSPYVAATVARGRTGTPMPAFSRDSANHSALTADEILDVSAFVHAGLLGVADGR
jgi:mono/diheme cytochrome c family protein/cytochrome c551/c552